MRDHLRRSWQTFPALALSTLLQASGVTTASSPATVARPSLCSTRRCAGSVDVSASCRAGPLRTVCNVKRWVWSASHWRQAPTRMATWIRVAAHSARTDCLKRRVWCTNGHAALDVADQRTVRKGQARPASAHEQSARCRQRPLQHRPLEHSSRSASLQAVRRAVCGTGGAAHALRQRPACLGAGDSRLADSVARAAQRAARLASARRLRPPRRLCSAWPALCARRSTCTLSRWGRGQQGGR